MEFLRKLTQAISGHRVLSILAVVLCVALAWGGKSIFDRSQGEESPPLARGPIVDAIYGIGTVTASRSYALKPGVTSTIAELDVKEGDFVRKGGKLASIEYTTYRAPFDGVVNYLPFKVGENVFTQIPLLVLTDLLNRYLVVSIEQQGAIRVRAGQSAKLSFDSIRGQNFDGKVISVYSYNSNFLARIDVPNLPPEILPDMTADIAIIVRQVPDVLLLPVSALENDSVWVKRPYRIPTQVRVKLGVVDGAFAQVVDGDLHEGDRVLFRKKTAP